MVSSQEVKKSGHGLLFNSWKKELSPLIAEVQKKSEQVGTGNDVPNALFVRVNDLFLFGQAPGIFSPTSFITSIFVQQKE